MTIQEVQQAYMRWKLRDGEWLYLSRQDRHAPATRQAEQEALDAYDAYLRARAQWDQGEVAA